MVAAFPAISGMYETWILDIFSADLQQVNIKFTLKRLLEIRLFIDKYTSFKRKS